MSTIEKKYGKSFCVSPWVHAYFKPTGEINLCCMNNDNLGTLKDGNLLEAWNNSGFRESRRKFLTGGSPKGCDSCFSLEKAGSHSQRDVLNARYGPSTLEFIEQTNRDGGVDRLNFKYLDLRWSNLCNFKCRFCSMEYSSSWFEDVVQLEGRQKLEQKKLVKLDLPWEVIRDQILPHAETICFAGGEPLLIQDTYRILQHLIETHRTDVHLSFVTNLSVLDHKGQNIFNLLQHFTQISFSVSVDGTGAQFEYMRKGGVWKKFKENLLVAKKFFAQRTNFQDQLQLHLSIYFLNALRATEILDELEYQFNIPVRINLSTSPDYSRADYLPLEIKKNVLQRYAGYQGVNADILRSFVESTTIDQKAAWSHFHYMLKWTSELDKIRGENFLHVFPEWASLLRRHKIATDFLI
jgi:sulfatase maturation enzyme AslB (radical SAM superfamily)